jgi:hypothetical protein
MGETTKNMGETTKIQLNRCGVCGRNPRRGRALKEIGASYSWVNCNKSDHNMTVYAKTQSEADSRWNKAFQRTEGR